MIGLSESNFLPSPGGTPPPPLKVRFPEHGQMMIIRAATGAIEYHPILGMPRIRTILKADVLDTVNLKRPNPGLVMILDDQSHKKALPPNALATSLYHANCKPGTTHGIRGDVVIIWDADLPD